MSVGDVHVPPEGFTTEEKLTEIRRQISFHVQHEKRRYKSSGKPTPASVLRRIGVLKSIAIDLQERLKTEGMGNVEHRGDGLSAGMAERVAADASRSA